MSETETDVLADIVAALEPLDGPVRARVLRWALSRFAGLDSPAPVTALPEAAVRAAAQVRLRQYESEFEAGHLTWRDFADEVTEVLRAAMPELLGKENGHD